MPRATFPYLALTSLLAGGLLIAIFTYLLTGSRDTLRAEIHRKIIERDAAVLYPVAMQQLAEVAADVIDSPSDTEEFTPVLRSAQQDGMLAVAVFDSSGNPVRAVPSTLLFVELPVDDFLDLTRLKSISRYHPGFPLDRTFAGIDQNRAKAPVLEVLLPLHHRNSTKLSGVARYYIDARPLAIELALIDRQIDRETATTIVSATLLITLVVAVAYFGLNRAQRLITERNERLIRANFELTLSAKASALGQITSHLIHGLQGPVAGLRAVVAGRDSSPASSDWETAAGYTERMQALIQETVALLGDSSTHTSYELTGDELASLLRQRNAATAKLKRIIFNVHTGPGISVDSHRGGLLCLIINNLVKNSLDATEAGKNVLVNLKRDGVTATVTVSDEGTGIPEELRTQLFKPGRSGRNGGSGLGLAISHLLARQINASLTLESTGPEGTRFKLEFPLSSA